MSEQRCLKKGSFFKSLLLIFFVSFLLFAQKIHAESFENTLIAVNLAYQDPDPVEPGDYVELKFNVKNTGGNVAKSVEFQILPEYPLSIYDNANNTVAVGDIEVYDASKTDTHEVSFKTRLAVDPNAIEGTYDLQLKYRAIGGSSENIWQDLKPIKVKIQTSKTQLYIADVHTDPERVRPGEAVNLFITLKNLGGTTLEDIKAALDFDNATSFAPYQSSNEKIINHLSPGEESVLQFGIISESDTLLRPHKIPLQLTYQDPSGKAYEKRLYVSIIIYAEPEFVLNLEDRDVYQKGQRGKVVVSLSNIGASNINYVTLDLQQSDAYEIISSPTVYIGNLESDDYETAQFDIYTKEYQPELPLSFKLYYKDSFNKNYQDEIVLPLKLFTAHEATLYGVSKERSNLLVVMVIVVLILSFLLYYFKYYRQKKKLSL